MIPRKVPGLNFTMLWNRQSRAMAIFGQDDVAPGLALANPPGVKEGLYSLFARDVGENAHLLRLGQFHLVEIRTGGVGKQECH